MKVVIRVDASRQIGTGHVMRCLTLADMLFSKGADCQFICRVHEGNLIDFIRSKGFIVHQLPITQTGGAKVTTPYLNLPFTDFDDYQRLGATQSQDAEACASIMAARDTDWLIVDHYQLDSRWEHTLKPYCHKLMVIDDLANRPHSCDLLLDQTFGRKFVDYNHLLPANCRLLCGTSYALLRPEFSVLRPHSLKRRVNPALRELLITMGGVDENNITGHVLQILRTCHLPKDCNITVVMGKTSPWLSEVRTQAQEIPQETRVLIGVGNMAQLMADSDLAIGAAGTTSWERCCLGLPALIFVLAENQYKVGQELEKVGAAKLIRLGEDSDVNLREALGSMINNPNQLLQMSKSAMKIVDGSGVNAVLRNMQM